jgi:poly(3-hydroxyalkanoate) synthetase
MNEYGAFGGMRNGKGNRSTLRKSASVLLCPSQIPRYMIWDRTRTATVVRYTLHNRIYVKSFVTASEGSEIT